MENKIRTSLRKDRKRIQISFPKQGRTKQAHKEECDVNNIVKRLDNGGFFPPQNQTTYGDYSSALSYQESLNIVMEAQERFASLPSHIRSRFGNDPATFLSAVGDPNMVEEFIKLGLATEQEPSSKPNAPISGASKGPGKGHSPKKPGPSGTGSPAEGEGPDA